MAETRRAEIDRQWQDAFKLRVGLAGVVRWDIDFRETRTTAALTNLAHLMPEGWWRRPNVLSVMGGCMGPALHAGKLRLAGTVPNGQRCQGRPMRVWDVKTSSATIDGNSAGIPKPLAKQLNLADFW